MTPSIPMWFAVAVAAGIAVYLAYTVARGLLIWFAARREEKARRELMMRLLREKRIEQEAFIWDIKTIRRSVLEKLNKDLKNKTDIVNPPTPPEKP